MYDPVLGRWMTTDPLAEKYYSISPYAYCANNPVKYIDPNGMDIWEFDSWGNVTNRIQDNTVDAFYMMEPDENGELRRSDKGLEFKHGTVTGYRTPPRGETQLTIFEMNGDNNAAQLFEFMANPDATTNVEWTHAKIGTESSGRNIVGTSHSQSSTGIGSYLLGPGDYTLREVNHNHPNGVPIPSEADMQNVRHYTGKFPGVGLNIYAPAYGYSPYNSSGTMDSRIITRPDGSYVLPDGRTAR
jgi:hypothetical protein